MLVPHKSRKLRSPAFTIIEALVAIALISFMGTGLIGTILMARQMAEYDKQTIAAISAARDYIERQRNITFPAALSINDVQLDNFNTPSTLDDLNATLDVSLYIVNPDGTRGDSIQSTRYLNNLELVEVEVRIEWNRTGSLSSHRVIETLHTYIGADY